MTRSRGGPFRAWHLPPGCSPRPDEVVDLPAGELPSLQRLALSPSRLRELAGALRAERETGLLGRSVGDVAKVVDRVARRLLDPVDPLRKATLESLGPQTGLSRPMAAEVLEGMARQWTRGALEALLASDFPDPGVLDGFRDGPAGSRIRALGHPLTFHLGAGTVPGVAVTSLIRALLVKSAVLLKPGRGDVVLPVAFAAGLEEADEELAGAVAVMYWPGDAGGGEGATTVALDEADLVVGYGGDDTLRRIRDALPPTTPLRAYRHRMGVGLVGRGALTRGGASGTERGSAGSGEGGGWERARATAEAVARAVALFDQRGCVSPHAVLVEDGGETSPGEWTDLLAESLAALEKALPSGVVGRDEGAALQQLRGTAEMEEAVGRGMVRHGGSASPWTVLYRPGGKVEPSCLNRTVRVIPVADLEGSLALLEPWKAHLQTVGVAGLGEGEGRIVHRLSVLGVSRVADFGRVPWPPAWWHHDGTGPLRALVRWTDVEGELR